MTRTFLRRLVHAKWLYNDGLRTAAYAAFLSFPTPYSDPPGDFGWNDNGDTAILFFYSLHFFVISKLIDRLSEKYVSYLSDVSPARSSHANCVEDSLSLSRVRASMQNALISLPMYRSTGWKYYLESVPRRMRAILYRELIYCWHVSENIVSLVKRNTKYCWQRQLWEL